MDGNFVVILVGGAAMIFLITSMFAFAYLYQKKINRKSNEITEIQELLKTEELKSAYALLEGQDKERQRVANDLHDRMGGQLSTVKIYLDLLEKTELTTKQQELLEKLQHSTKITIEEVRAIAHDLNNSTLNYYGLQKAIEHLCTVISESKKLNVAHHLDLQVESSTSFKRDIYQIIQELITNTLRHAEAKNVRIELNILKDGTNLIYEDDGVGFNPETVVQGIGLRSIEMRAERYDGTLIIDGKKGRGASFIIEIPEQHE
jgi:two-component system NarL family sensor kinase